MVAIDSVARLIPGVLGNETSAVTDSFSTGLLEYPHYTRPPEFRGMKVPDVLLSGHHLNIDAWRREQSLIRTLERRPDMLDTAELTEKNGYGSINFVLRWNGLPSSCTYFKIAW